MCGVCGIVYKQGAAESRAPIGAELIKMLEALVHRGADSTGVTVAGEGTDEDLIVRLWAKQVNGHQALFERAEEAVVAAGGRVSSRQATGEYLRLGVTWRGDPRKLADTLMHLPGIEVHSIGGHSEIIKDVGTAAALDRRHDVSALTGTHGIGHVRLATESRVDISHSHPFWAYPYPDITVVHNGQLTNYHKLKRQYEEQGYQFQSENDSELIAVYLADKLARGITLDEALHEALEELDGTFTFLISTKDGLGFAKDQWSAKPLVTMETDELVAIASEEIALRSVFPQEIERIEPQQSEVMTWSM